MIWTISLTILFYSLFWATVFYILSRPIHPQLED